MPVVADGCGARRIAAATLCDSDQFRPVWLFGRVESGTGAGAEPAAGRGGLVHLFARLAPVSRLDHLRCAVLGRDRFPSTEQVLFAAAFRAGSLGLLLVHGYSRFAG